MLTLCVHVLQGYMSLCFIELQRHHFSLNYRFHVKASVASEIDKFSLQLQICILLAVYMMWGWGAFFPILPFSSSPSLDSILFFFLSYIRSLWFCPASQFFMELQHFKEFFFSPLLLPRQSAGQVWERDCPSEVGCYQQGAACLQFRSALATDGDFKASHNTSCDPSKHAC